jgi:hypothetical protein
MDMRFGTLNVRSLYTAGSLVTVSKELLKYTLYLMGVQEVSRKIHFYMGNENHELGTGII